MIKSKLIVKHIPDCVGVENFKNGTWPTPFALGFHHFGKWGISKNNSLLISQCNDARCPAKIAVLEDDVLAQINHEGLLITE